MEKLQTAPSPYAALTMPLEADDHLHRTTFHTLYEAMPSALRAELIGGVVLVPSPLRWVTRCQTSGVSATAGPRSRSPIRALTAIACCTVKAVASTPISSVPRGVAVPMQTLRRPIILPRIVVGVTSIVMVLCIVLKPA